MNRLTLYVIIPSLLLFQCVFAGARDMQRVSEDIPADSEVKTIHLKLDIGLANILLETHDGGDILTADVKYDADKLKVDIDYEKSGSEADIYIVSDQIKRRYNLDSDDCRWRISLSTDYIWDFDLDAGFAECRINLSGLPLERVRLDLGASECRLMFNEPNPHRLRKFDVDAGAGELHMLGLGFANFDDLNFDGGAGEFVLNFEGQSEGMRSANIDVGVGEVVVELPEDLPVRIETDEGWLSSIDLDCRDLIETDEDLYETEDFSEAGYGLEIDLNIGIGEATITTVD